MITLSLVIMEVLCCFAEAGILCMTPNRGFPNIYFKSNQQIFHTWKLLGMRFEWAPKLSR